MGVTIHYGGFVKSQDKVTAITKDAAQIAENYKVQHSLVQSSGYVVESRTYTDDPKHFKEWAEYEKKWGGWTGEDRAHGRYIANWDYYEKDKAQNMFGDKLQSMILEGKAHPSKELGIVMNPSMTAESFSLEFHQLPDGKWKMREFMKTQAFDRKEIPENLKAHIFAAGTLEFIRKKHMPSLRIHDEADYSFTETERRENIEHWKEKLKNRDDPYYDLAGEQIEFWESAKPHDPRNILKSWGENLEVINQIGEQLKQAGWGEENIAKGMPINVSPSKEAKRISTQYKGKQGETAVDIYQKGEETKAVVERPRNVSYVEPSPETKPKNVPRLSDSRSKILIMTVEGQELNSVDDVDKSISQIEKADTQPEFRVRNYSSALEEIRNIKVVFTGEDLAGAERRMRLETTLGEISTPVKRFPHATVELDDTSKKALKAEERIVQKYKVAITERTAEVQETIKTKKDSWEGSNAEKELRKLNAESNKLDHREKELERIIKGEPLKARPPEKLKPTEKVEITKVEYKGTPAPPKAPAPKSSLDQEIAEGRARSEAKYGHLTLRQAALATKSEEEFINYVIRYNRRRINELTRWAPKDERGYPTQGWIESGSQYWRRVREPKVRAKPKETVAQPAQAPQVTRKARSRLVLRARIRSAPKAQAPPTSTDKYQIVLVDKQGRVSGLSKPMSQQAARESLGRLSNTEYSRSKIRPHRKSLATRLMKGY